VTGLLVKTCSRFSSVCVEIFSSICYTFHRMFTYLVDLITDHFKSIVTGSLFTLIISVCNQIGLMKDAFNKLGWTPQAQACVNTFSFIMLILSAVALFIVGVSSILKRFLHSF
jgi:hypothetical protein